jgi:hypothetical protein
MSAEEIRKIINLMENGTKHPSISNVQPIMDFPEQDQLTQFQHFGTKLAQLIDSYSKFNADERSVPSGWHGASRLYSTQNGKVEFFSTLTYYQHNMGLSFRRDGMFVVNIGTAFAKEKEFEAAYVDLVLTQLPMHVTFEDDAVKRVSINKTFGTSFTRLGILLD